MNRFNASLALCAVVSAMIAAAARAQVYVNTGTTVSEYTNAGGFVRNVVTANLTGAQDATFGPDGMLYVADDSAGAIKKFNPDTGAFLGSVITGLNRATDCEFGTDGSLYVSEYNANRVLRVNAATGIVLQTYSGVAAVLGLEFMPNGDLLATEGNGGGNIRRINTTTGAVTSFLVSTNIADVHLLPNGNYVFTDRSGSQLHQTTSAGGSFTNFTTGSVPSFPYFMDHTADTLFVGSVTNGVYRYNVNTGAFLGSFGPSGATGVAVRGSAAPEPAAWALLLPGLLATRRVVARRRQRKTA